MTSFRSPHIAYRWRPQALAYVILIPLLGLVFSTLASAVTPYHFSINEDGLTGALDQSSLNSPISSSDRIIANGPHFYQIGPDLKPHTGDDIRIRFFGVNLSYAANFPAPEQASLIAKRLRKLGFNAVRLHHLDSAPSNQTDPPRSILTPAPYPSFNAEAVSRLRTFITALAKEGIYINLNLHVGYRFKASDGIPAHEARGMQRPNATPIKIFEPTLIEKQKIYATQLIEQLGLKQANNLAMVEISNESSLLAAWHRKEWFDAIPGPYYDILSKLWHDWLEQRYTTPETACRHWQTCNDEDHWPLLPEPLSASTQHSLTDLGHRLKKQLNKWVPTLHSIPQPPNSSPLLADFQLFLAETDRHYFTTLRSTIQRQAGWPIPVTGSQMSYGGLMNFVSHQDMDYFDDHTYVDHPEFLQGSGQPRNWRIWDVSATGKHMDEVVSNIAYRRHSHKPFVVSEFNHPFPSRQGAEFLPVMTTFASLQDWDGLFFFDYTDTYDEKDAPSNFALRGDWGKYANLGQSARLFREFQISPLTALHLFTLSPSFLAHFSALDAETSLISYLQKSTQHNTQDVWQRRIALQTNSHAGFKDQLKNVRSVTSNADYSSAAKRLVLTQPQAQGWFGTSAGSGPSPETAVLKVSTKQNTPASVLVSSQDGKAIKQSKHLLISLGSSTVGSQPGATPARPKQWVRHPAGNNSWTLEPDPQHPKLPSGSRQATGPAWLFWTPTRLELKGVHPPIAVYPLDQSGHRRTALPTARIQHSEASLTLDLQQTAKEASLWYELVLP